MAAPSPRTAISPALARKEPATMRRMFGAIAPRYDLLNHLLSGGLDLLWRRVAVAALLTHLETPSASRSGTRAMQDDRAAHSRRGHRVLDLCAGTLDLACALSDTRRFHGKTIAVDFALPMLRRGRHKLGGRRSRQVVPVCADGLRLPFADAAFDAAMIGFGVRNLADLDAGLVEIGRVLAPSGALLILEFSRPENGVVRGFFDLYSRRVLPAVGGAISGHPDAYRYLPDSVAAFPDASGLAARLEAAGFERVKARPLSGGIVAVHVGRKPARAAAAAAEARRPAAVTSP